MAIEYIAFITEEDYRAFRILVTTPLPRDYEMWLRVRETGKLRTIAERAAEVLQVQVSGAASKAADLGGGRPPPSIAHSDG